MRVLALLGFTSEAHWLRHARAHLHTLLPYLPQQSGYNKRLRKLTDTIGWLISVLGREVSMFTDDVWIADSTPVECGRSRETARRSDLAGFAEYGYCASHSRYFWGLRLHLLCTLQGLPIGAAQTGARFFKPLRQIIESINDTFKGQLDLEPTAGTPPPASSPACGNTSSPSPPPSGTIGAPVKRSLTAYDH